MIKVIFIGLMLFCFVGYGQPDLYTSCEDYVIYCWQRDEPGRVITNASWIAAKKICQRADEEDAKRVKKLLASITDEERGPVYKHATQMKERIIKFNKDGAGLDIDWDSTVAWCLEEHRAGNIYNDKGEIIKYGSWDK